MKQPEALFLADAIDADNYGAAETQIEFKAAAELRRLHSLNQELLEALDFYGSYILRKKSNGECSILAPIEHDCGDRARAAIAKAKEQE